jgi:hypothetical protein
VSVLVLNALAFRVKLDGKKVAILTAKLKPISNDSITASVNVHLLDRCAWLRAHDRCQCIPRHLIESNYGGINTAMNVPLNSPGFNIAVNDTSCEKRRAENRDK